MPAPKAQALQPKNGADPSKVAAETATTGKPSKRSIVRAKSAAKAANGLVVALVAATIAAGESFCFRPSEISGETFSGVQFPSNSSEGKTSHDDYVNATI